jgi:hypothetical protein
MRGDQRWQGEHDPEQGGAESVGDCYPLHADDRPGGAQDVPG